MLLVGLLVFGVLEDEARLAPEVGPDARLAAHDSKSLMKIDIIYLGQ